MKWLHIKTLLRLTAVVLNIVSDDEIPRLQEVLQSLQKVSKAAAELQIWMDKLKGLKA